MIEFANPARGSVQKTAECKCCGEQLVWRPKPSRLTKLAKRHPWFHAETLKEECQPLVLGQFRVKPVVYDAYVVGVSDLSTGVGREHSA